MSNSKQTYKIYPSNERGQANHGWLKSKHTFSFADYYNPHCIGFRTLKVINQDVVAPLGGFATHAHKDMEIFSYVLEGELAHKDSLGNERILKPGEVQLMSAGSGITHSEFNPSDTKILHFLQIWILPNQNELQPSYSEWKQGDDKAKSLLISPCGSKGSATINQDAYVYRIKMNKDEIISHELNKNRGAWFQLIAGSVTICNEVIHAGDAFSTETDGILEIKANETVEGLLFDLA